MDCGMVLEAVLGRKGSKRSWGGLGAKKTEVVLRSFKRVLVSLKKRPKVQGREGKEHMHSVIK